MFEFSIITKASGGKIRKRDAETLNEYIGSFSGDLEIILRPPKKQRSTKENNYYWGVVIPLLIPSLGYRRIDKNEVHEFLKYKFGYKKTIEVNGEEVEYVRSTTTYSTVEFEDYLDTIRHWASDLGINIPEPNE